MDRGGSCILRSILTARRPATALCGCHPCRRPTTALGLAQQQGIFDDLNPETRARWAYPDTKKWDPDRNTREFVAAMPQCHSMMNSPTSSQLSRQRRGCWRLGLPNEVTFLARCCFFGCAGSGDSGAGAATGQKATRGVDYAKTQVENARKIVDGAAARAEKIIDRVDVDLDSARTVIASAGRSRQHSWNLFSGSQPEKTLKLIGPGLALNTTKWHAE
jgi:hypothetical protein